MSQPSVCIIHEGIGTYSAIARIAMGQARAALAAGWRVSVVAKFLDESLQGEVEWLRLYVPPRLFWLQWVTARHIIRQAQGGRRFDVVHAHQPQVADLGHVFQCHYLTRAAHERRCLETRPGLRPGLVRLQQQGVLRAEDGYYRRWNPRTRMLFNSELLREEFARHYGLPPLEGVFLYPCPPLDMPSDAERAEARQALVGDWSRGPVLGFLGGLDERKGYRQLVPALAGAEDIFLLMGGLYCEGYSPPELSGRCRSLGLVNSRRFYAACDALIVPSLFEPFGLVALEAAMRGLPVIATPEVGALPQLLQYGAGMAWNRTEPLGPVVRQAVARTLDLQAGATRMALDTSEQRQAERLLCLYDEIRRGACGQSAALAAG